MTLSVHVEERAILTRLILDGRLDHESVEAFDRQLEAVLAQPIKVLVFDLDRLEYVTSAGLRSIFRAQKAMNARGGKALLLNPQPPVKKVLEIVKVPELGRIFQSVQELDAYLDEMQKKVAEGD
jgi:anti-anti-sigma factor